MELQVSQALSGLSSQLLAETRLLQSLRDAVSMERKELERLHKVDIAKTAIDQLVQEYTETKARLEDELSQSRSQWARESEEAEKQQKQQEEELKRQRSREKEDYEYKLALERKKEQDAYDEAQQARERENQRKQEAMEKSWSEREARLKEREDELSRLRQDVASFPERLKKETDRAVMEATRSLQADHKQSFALAQKDMESERRLAELRVKSLEETASRQAEEIKSLTARLEESKKQVQDIAIKAIEGASGARALSHVNQIAMEQAKPRGPAQP